MSALSEISCSGPSFGSCHMAHIRFQRYGGREGTELLIFTDTQTQPI